MGGHLFVFSRPLASSVIGVCLGITLSVIFTPFLEDRCMQALVRDHGQSQRDIGDLKTQSAQPLIPPHKNSNNVISTGDLAGNPKGIDIPRKNVVESVKNMEVPNDVLKARKINPPYSGKPVRPRYAYAELGIRDKLFVAVITSPDTIDTFAVAVNLTLAHYVTNIVFFVDSDSPITLEGQQTVSLSTPRSLLPLRTLKHIAMNYAHTYDYYYFLSDLTYTRGQRLFDFVSHISVSEDLYVGAANPYSSQSHCGLDGGIIISQRLMSMIYGQLNDCILNYQTDNPSENLASCVSHATGRQCSQTLGLNVYKSFYVDGDTSLTSLSQNAAFTSSLSFYPLSDHRSFYTLHKYFCQLEINSTLQEIEELKNNIVTLSMYTPAGKEGLTWPIGVPASLKPKSRFDVIRWTYFTSTHIYFDTDFSNEKPLEGIDKTDVDEIIRVCVEKINTDEGHEYTLHRLVNGYRRFDAQRGMEYILDLEIRDNQINGGVLETRLYAVRPLGPVEVVPMPFASENAEITHILPIRPEETTMMQRFLGFYSKLGTQNYELRSLVVLFIYTTKGRDNADVHEAAKDEIRDFSRKQGRFARVTTISLYTTGGEYVPEITIIDEVLKNIETTSIISLCSVGMLLTAEYMGRVRVNTIPGEQVFFPMPFFQFKPELIFDKPPYPLTVEIRRGLGFFDTNSYEHSSFYAADYTNARKAVRTDAIASTDLFQLFINYRRFHIFRSVEPTLTHFYIPIPCERDLPVEFKERCQKRRNDGLASKSRLAMLLFEMNKIK